MSVTRKLKARALFPGYRFTPIAGEDPSAPPLARRVDVPWIVAAGLGTGIAATFLVFERRPGLGYTLLSYFPLPLARGCGGLKASEMMSSGEDGNDARSRGQRAWAEWDHV